MNKSNGACWENTSLKSGVKYMNCHIEINEIKYKFVIYKNGYKINKQPDYIILLKDKKDKDKDTENTTNKTENKTVEIINDDDFLDKQDKQAEEINEGQELP